MVWTSLVGIPTQLVVASALSWGLLQMEKRSKRPNKGDLGSAAGFLIASSVIGDIIAYSWSFNGNSVSYSLLSLFCLSTFLVPIVMAPASGTRFRSQRNQSVLQIFAPGVLALVCVIGLLSVGIWAGTMNSPYPEQAMGYAYYSAITLVIGLSLFYFFFIGTMRSGGAG